MAATQLMTNDRVFLSYYHHMPIFYLLNFKTSNLSKFRDPHKIKGMKISKCQCWWTVQGWWVNMSSGSLGFRYWVKATPTFSISHHRILSRNSLTGPIMAISQYMHILNHYVVHLKLKNVVCQAYLNFIFFLKRKFLPRVYFTKNWKTTFSSGVLIFQPVIFLPMTHASSWQTWKDQAEFWHCLPSF